MSSSASPFRFEHADLPAAPGWVAEVRAGIATKQALLDDLRQCLRLPDYFGQNWDALEECIRDLSWLPGGTVLLRHHDLPLAGDVAGRMTYLSILGDAAEKRFALPGQVMPDLVVLFPADTRDEIARLLRSAEGE